MVKKRRGAAEVEVRSEVGDVAEAAKEAESESKEAAGSRLFCRLRRFDSISKND